MDELYEASVTCRHCKHFNSNIDNGYCETFKHAVSPHEDICDDRFEINEYWLQLDSELQSDGWHLQINRHYNEWKALYVNQCELPRSAKGSTVQEAVENVYKLIREGR